ncbi:MAG: hypothetical protein FJ044_03480 [Candidatus Cloacimonetes bacterium]|nr:hypothetical protein [Candidatus Cloacimonadota bacterium]
MKEEIKIEEIENKTKYILTLMPKEYYITAVVDKKNNRLDIYPRLYSNLGFEFKDSKPEIVEAIGKLLIKAAEIVEEK